MESNPEDLTRAEQTLYPPLAREARRGILRAARQGRLQTIRHLHLDSHTFSQQVDGFHSIEQLEDGTAFRWMSRNAALLLAPEVRALQLELKGFAEEAPFAISINGVETASWVIGPDWSDKELSLPLTTEPCLVTFAADLAMEAPGDNRELTVMFRKFYSLPGNDIEERNPFPFLPKPRPQLLSPPLPEFTESISDDSTEQESGFDTVVITLKFFRPRDAISMEVEEMAHLLRNEGLSVLLLAEQAHPDWAEKLASLAALGEALSSPRTLLIYHHSTYWEYGERLFRYSRCQMRLLRYHNVSLSECFLDHPFGYLENTIDGRIQTSTLVSMATRIAAPSYWAMGDLMASGASPEITCRLPVLRQWESFSTQETDPAIARRLETVQGPHFLVLGRQVPSKGLHHALHILNEYRQRFSDQIHVWIVGPVDPLMLSYHHELQQYVSNKGLDDWVSFEGESDRRAVATWLQGCDALVTMSESDAAPLPIVEAASFGKPILGLNQGGKAEGAGPGQMLFNSLDYRIHAEAWHRVATNEKLRTALGQAAKAHFEANYSGEKGDRQFLSLIDELRLPPAGS